MQKKLISNLLLAVVAFFMQVMPLAAGPDPIQSMNGCEAPPPSNLAVINQTPTSLTLNWLPSAFQYYKIDMYDLTGGFALPPVYTVSAPITINGLIPAHDYEINVSASYCQQGPYGEPATILGKTPGIVVDMIIYLQSPCTPPAGNVLPANSVREICVNGSTVPNMPYTNGTVGKVVYNNETLYFGMAWVQDLNFLFVNKVGNSGYPSSNAFSFIPSQGTSGSPTSPSAYTICKYNGIEIFRIDLSVDALYPSVAKTTCTFYQQCTFSRCGAVSCYPSSLTDSGNDADELTEKEQDQPSERSQLENQVVTAFPNPFSQSVTVQYSLEEPAWVEIGLYDALGRLVRNVQSAEMLPEGTYETIIEGEDLADGVYFLGIQAGDDRKTFPLIKQE